MRFSQSMDESLTLSANSAEATDSLGTNWAMDSVREMRYTYFACDVPLATAGAMETEWQAPGLSLLNKARIASFSNRTLRGKTVGHQPGV